MPVFSVPRPANCKVSEAICWASRQFAKSAPLLKATIELMRQYRIADPEFGSAALGVVVPANDSRGQTVLYDLRQFENDLKEAARRLGKNVPPFSRWDATQTADNVFAWVYALQSGMLD